MRESEGGKLDHSWRGAAHAGTDGVKGPTLGRRSTLKTTRRRCNLQDVVTIPNTMHTTIVVVTVEELFGHSLVSTHDATRDKPGARSQNLYHE